MSEWFMPEQEVVKRLCSLGLQRRECMAIRTVNKGLEFWRLEELPNAHNGKPQPVVVWLVPGLEKIRAAHTPEIAPEVFWEALGVPVPVREEKAPPGASTAQDEPEKNSATKILTVKKTDFPNPHLLLAQDSEGVNRLVRVKNKQVFQLGTKILAAPGSDARQPWTFQGNPADPTAEPVYPLRPGVWPAVKRQATQKPIES